MSDLCQDEGCPHSNVDHVCTRPAFEARPVLETPWVWEVWDIEHPASGNHFPVVRVDSKGAADDFHESYAKLIAGCLNKHLALAEARGDA